MKGHLEPVSADKPKRRAKDEGPRGDRVMTSALYGDYSAVFTFKAGLVMS